MLKQILSLISFVFIVIISFIYSNLKKNRNLIRKQCFDLDFKFKERIKLLSKLLDSTKEYSIYNEKNIENLKIENYDTWNIEKKLDVDRNISIIVHKVIDIADKYTNLNEKNEFLELKKQLIKIDSNINKDLYNYNNYVEKYNNLIKNRGCILIAILFGFNEEKKLK